MSRTTRLLVTSAFCLVSTAAVQAGVAEQHLDTSAAAPKRFSADLSWADVTINAISGDKVTVKADLKVDMSGSDEAAQKCLDKNKVNLVTEGDMLVVRQGEKGKSNNCGMGSKKWTGKVVIGLPAGIPMGVDIASGESTLTGDFGDIAVRANVASGGFNLNGRVKELEVDIASGNVRVDTTKPLSRLDVDVASGTVTLKGGAEDVKVDTASGDVTLEGLLGSVSGDSASGSFTLAWDRFPGTAKVNLEAASGDVQLTLPAGVNPSGHLSANSGTISGDLSGATKVDKRSVRLSGNTGSLVVDSSSGDITLKRK